MVVVVGFVVLLLKFSGSFDVVVGFFIVGCSDFVLDNLVGFFVNILVLWVNLVGDFSFVELLG